MAEPTEDITGDIDPFATPDNSNQESDPDQPHKSVLVEVSEELARDIAEHNSFDCLNLPKNATTEQKAAVFDEIAVHKGLAVHLSKYKTMIDNKIKEL